MSINLKRTLFDFVILVFLSVSVNLNANNSILQQNSYFVEVLQHDNEKSSLVRKSYDISVARHNTYTYSTKKDKETMSSCYKGNYSNIGTDLDYLYNFVRMDYFNLLKTTKPYTLKTQAFNAIRISWENEQLLDAKYYGACNDCDCLYKIKNLYIINNALYRSRAILLHLISNHKYRDDSGIYLAIAISYYLQDSIFYRHKIKYYMNKWRIFGGEIPKNLIKMTSYEDSIFTIESLK